ncbi:MAG: sigma 54-interacting transcriptional regulator, partial [Minicystis sp.]
MPTGARALEGPGGGAEDDGLPTGGALQLAVLSRDAEWICRLPVQGEIVIGRASDCNLQIDDPAVSRQHVILRVGSEIQVECLSPTNPIFITRLGDALPRGSAALKWRRASQPCVVTLSDALLLGSSVIVIRKAPASEPIGESSYLVTVRQAIIPFVSGPIYVPPGQLQLLLRAQRVGRLQLNVLIMGEVGVGKSALAQAIHRGSTRADRSFSMLSCSAYAADPHLLESVLFGHEMGAFPEARVARPGAFELADGGTLVLDEIDTLDDRLQGRLRIALHDRRIYRMTSGTPRLVDVRVIATTERNLVEEVERGAFQRDLLEELRGAVFTVPPLRERVDDIGPLALSLLADTSAALGETTPLTLSPEALLLLQQHPWPGNLRELRNVIEQAAAECQGRELLPEHLKQLSFESRKRYVPTIPPPGLLLPRSLVDLLYDAAIAAELAPRDL